jgi:hypothetical protein
MANQVIVLERQQGTNVTLRVLLWFPVPANRQILYASPGAKSQWKQAAQADHDAIAAGAVVEQVEMVDLPQGTTITSAKALLVALYTSRLGDFNADSALHGQFYGTRYDGSAWTDANLT